MLSIEQNERLTRVGPGTPGGEMMRRYWHPIAPTAMLDENPVKSVRILGEDLVLYKDRSGTLGLIGRQCGHRLVDMVFGIPEDKGLRCPYHGWCYDETGQCIETPLESPSSKLKDHVNIGGYPVQELGGLVWGYLGPQPVPVLPPYDFLVWPNSIRQIGITNIPCNWLQCHENSADPYHNTYLHGHYFKYVLERLGIWEERAPDPGVHRAGLSMRFTDFSDGVSFERDELGFHKGIKISKAKGAVQDMVKPFPYNIFPYYSRGAGGFRCQVNMRVPMDDTHTYHLSYIVFHAQDIEAPAQASVPYFRAPLFDDKGDPVLDYLLAQDMTAWWSQGNIADRSKEQLGATDLAIIEFRRMIEEQIIAVEEGRTPMGVSYDKEEWGKILQFTPRFSDRPSSSNAAVGSLRANYSVADDVERYSPTAPLLEEFMRAMAEAKERV
jgi:5,5'-dehydrodivanillate O-demethylase